MISVLSALPLRPPLGPRLRLEFDKDSALASPRPPEPILPLEINLHSALPHRPLRPLLHLVREAGLVNPLKVSRSVILPLVLLLSLLPTPTPPDHSVTHSRPIPVPPHLLPLPPRISGETPFRPTTTYQLKSRLFSPRIKPSLAARQQLAILSAQTR